ncbi:hypothetical protein FRC00_007849 [Tulasnella sp. 408]|nr:hypothetical protein FRC00_007849 [Tulasnella sp. 408]
MLYQYLLATALLAGSGSAAGLVRRQAETPFTTVVMVTVGADETDRPLICPCPTSISIDPVPTSRQYTLPVTSPSLAVAKRQEPYTTTITENLPGTSVIILTATCTCGTPSGGNTTPTTAPTTVSAATPSTTTAAPSASTIRASSAASTSSASTGAAQGNGASTQNFRGGRTFGAAVAAMVAGAAFLALVA